MGSLPHLTFLVGSRGMRLTMTGENMLKDIELGWTTPGYFDAFVSLFVRCATALEMCHCLL